MDDAWWPELTYGNDWWLEMAYEDSLDAFLEQEMSYADAMAEAEEIGTDEGGWGVE